MQTQTGEQAHVPRQQRAASRTRLGLGLARALHGVLAAEELTLDRIGTLRLHSDKGVHVRESACLCVGRCVRLHACACV